MKEYKFDKFDVMIIVGVLSFLIIFSFLGIQFLNRESKECEEIGGVYSSDTLSCWTNVEEYCEYFRSMYGSFLCKSYNVCKPYDVCD